MKHTFRALCLVLLLCSLLTIPALAFGEKKYLMSDAGITFSIPPDLIVTTGLDAETDTSDSGTIAVTPQLSAKDPAFKFVIMILAKDASEHEDFRISTDNEIITYGKNTMVNRLAVITEVYDQVYYQKQTKFLKTTIAHDVSGVPVYIQTYSTIHKTKEIIVQLSNVREEITSEIEAIVLSIVDSITFSDLSPMGMGDNLGYLSEPVPRPLDELVYEPEINNVSGVNAPDGSASGTLTTGYMKTYSISDLSMMVGVPSYLHVLSRDMDKDDPDLAFNGWDVDEATAILKQWDSYLYVIPSDWSYTILLSSYDVARRDFNDYASNSELLMVIQDLTWRGTVLDATTQIYTREQTKFAKTCVDYFKDDYIDELNYFTFINGQWILFSLHPTSGNITQQMEVDLKKIIDSVSFTNMPAYYPDAEVGVMTPLVEMPADYILRSRENYVHTISVVQNDKETDEDEDVSSAFLIGSQGEIITMDFSFLSIVHSTTASGLYLAIFLSIVLTIVIYTIPIIVYRFSVRKERLEAALAQLFVIIYGAVAVCVAVIVGNSTTNYLPVVMVVLWSVVNYRILRGPKQAPVDDH